MVFLKPTPIITAVIIKTLIVLTIIDHAFSDLEVEYCSKSIKELYRHSTLYHNQRIQDIGSTADDKSINDDPLKMFQKGFLVYNESEINLINIFIAAKSTVQFQDQFVKKTMMGRFKKYLQEFLSWMSPDDAENIRKVNEYFSERLQSVLDTEELKLTVEKMNYYSYGYFKELLNGVSINDKCSLKNPDQFCLEKYQERSVLSTAEGSTASYPAANLCSEITKQIFNLSGEESGSEIFDIFYEKWTINQVELARFLDEERKELRASYIMARLARRPRIDNRGSEFLEMHDIYNDSLASFYNQFVEKLKDADASQMETPEYYCARIIGEASNS